MTFEQMLRRAKGGDQEAITSILLMSCGKSLQDLPVLWFILSHTIWVW